MWQPPRDFDGFQIRGPLGAGGMGRVYLAQEMALDRPVALKFIAHDNESPALRDRFAVEAKAIARIQHPNVVAIYRIGDIEGHPYIAYEYVDGRSLDLIEKPVPWTVALELGLAVARALKVTHQRGVLHRDIKPANVIMAEDGTIKLVDFGVAKLVPTSTGGHELPVLQPPRVQQGHEPEMPRDDLATAETEQASSLLVRQGAEGESPLEQRATFTGLLIGTPRYLAPELWAGEHASARSDVYATGLLLYELASGELPYSGLRGAELKQRVTEGVPTPFGMLCPEIPVSFAGVVDRAIAHDPEHRFADGNELLTSLEQIDAVLRSFRLMAGARGHDDDVSRVAESLVRLQSRAEAFFASVYRRLFAGHPEIERLFPRSMIAQQMKLAAALRLIVENLRDPMKLVPVLEELGHRHHGYGVHPEYFPVFEEALLGAMQEFDEQWEPATERAWRRAYRVVTKVLARGIGEASTRASA